MSDNRKRLDEMVKTSVEANPIDSTMHPVYRIALSLLTQLDERDAMVAALREWISTTAQHPAFCGANWSKVGSYGADTCTCGKVEALSSTATAAREWEARITAPLLAEIELLKQSRQDEHLWPSTLIYSTAPYLMPDGKPSRMAALPTWVVDQVRREEREAAAFDAVVEAVRPNRVGSGWDVVLAPGGTWLTVKPEATNGSEPKPGDIVTIVPPRCIGLKSAILGGEGEGL